MSRRFGRKVLANDEGAHYSIFAVTTDDGMAVLRAFFPDAKADDLNLVLFSTSGVHGSYTAIEDAEQHLQSPSEETSSIVTFLVLQPRMVSVSYGNCKPQNADDIAFLKALRASSREALVGSSYV